MIRNHSLIEYLTGYLLESGAVTEASLHTFRPSVCNRLDRNTSGLVAAGKSLPGLQELSRIIKDRSIRKILPVPGEGAGEKQPSRI